MRHVTSEMTSLREVQQRQMREKDMELRRLKKAQLQLRQATDALQHAQQVLDEKQTDVSLSLTQLGSQHRRIDRLIDRLIK